MPKDKPFQVEALQRVPFVGPIFIWYCDKGHYMRVDNGALLPVCKCGSRLWSRLGNP